MFLLHELISAEVIRREAGVSRSVSKLVFVEWSHQSLFGSGILCLSQMCGESTTRGSSYFSNVIIFISTKLLLGSSHKPQISIHPPGADLNHETTRSPVVKEAKLGQISHIAWLWSFVLSSKLNTLGKNSRESEYDIIMHNAYHKAAHFNSDCTWFVSMFKFMIFLWL